MSSLEYRAGSAAIASLRARGLSKDELSALLLPAIGPKWLILSGFDRALLRAGWFAGRSRKLLLFGASVGAWRALALAARDPERAHRALLDAYCAQRFTHADSPEAISAAYRQLLAHVASEADLAHAVEHPHFDLAIATARARGPLAATHRRAQALALTAAALLHAASPRAAQRYLERMVFATAGHAAGNYPLLQAAGGVRGTLSVHNLREIALASGSVPLYMQMIRDPAGAPPGAYIDGGFSDYHLNRTADAGQGISLLVLHQRRIVPAWFDKFVPWRTLEASARSRLLQVYPTRELVRSLPGAAVPTREDFQRFVNEPELRIARWQAVAKRSDELAEEFLHDVQTGAIASRVKPFD